MNDLEQFQEIDSIVQPFRNNLVQQGFFGGVKFINKNDGFVENFIVDELIRRLDDGCILGEELIHTHE